MIVNSLIFNTALQNILESRPGIDTIILYSHFYNDVAIKEMSEIIGVSDEWVRIRIVSMLSEIKKEYEFLVKNKAELPILKNIDE